MAQDFFIIVLLMLTMATSIQGQRVSTNNVTVILVGLAGVGKSSTISKLFNGKYGPTTENELEPSIQEYTAFYLSLNTHLKIVDTTGLVVDMSPETDGQTLALLSAYLNNELNGQQPSILLVVSSFDDDRASGESSSFVKMLKSVQLLKAQLFKSNPADSNTTNVIFLFTQMARTTRSIARKPGPKLAQFHNIIANFTEFSEPIAMVVGENNPDGYGLAINSDGFASLANGELYPKNLIQKMIEWSGRLDDSTGQAVFQTLLGNFNNNAIMAYGDVRKIMYNASSELSETSAKFTQQLVGDSLQIQVDNEIASALKLTWDTEIDSATKRANPEALTLLQKIFQNANITERSQLPATVVDIVKLFLKLPNQEIFPVLLEETFGIKQQQLTTHLVAGYGYDLTTDSVLDSSPWSLGSAHIVSSVLGYSLPSEYIVTTLERQTEDVFHYVKLEEFVAIRLKYLENVPETLANFAGTVRLAFNVEPLDSDVNHFSLSAIKEFQKFKLQMDETQIGLSAEFIEWLNHLTAFDATDRESEKEWKSFFSEFGTHVITSAYGGGYVQGTMELGSYIQNLSSVSLNDLKNSLLELSPLPASVRDDVQLVHNYFGGIPNLDMESIFQLNSTSKQKLMEVWEQSILYKPIIMRTRLSLKPIGELASRFNSSIGEIVKKAAKLFYEGNLVYQQPKRKKSSTVAPIIRATTSTTAKTTPTEHSTEPSLTRPRVFSNNNNNYQIPTTARPIQTCPQPPCVCPTNLPSKPDPTIGSPILIKDAELHVGYGFNMFYDSGVPKSPFFLGPLKKSIGFNYHECVNTTKYADPVFNDFCRICHSTKEYIEERLKWIESSGSAKTWSQYNSNIHSLKESNYHYTGIKPGYNVISDWRVSNRISYNAEEKLHKIFIEDWQKLRFDDEFRNEVDNLPEFNPRNCQSKRAWMNLLEKFGTHVVTSRNVGYSTEVIKHVNVKDNARSSGNLCAAVNHSLRLAHNADNHQSFSKSMLDLNFLNFDMEFVEMSNIIKKIDYLKGADCDTAIRDLWDFGPKCRY